MKESEVEYEPMKMHKQLHADAVELHEKVKGMQNKVAYDKVHYKG